MEQENRVRMERIAADPQSGLSAEQVKRRFAQGENNYKVESSTLSVPEIVRSNVCTYFNLVFAVIAVLLAIVGAWSDMLFLPIIVANTCIGIIQEVHSKKVLDKLSILNAPHAVVIRDGKRQEIPADQLVLDDIVEFSAGSQIPADAKVVSGELQVNESLITGESDEIEKREGDSLLSGSFVVSGKACARLEKVGKDSYISKLTLQATKSKKGEQSEMIRSLNYLIMVMGIIIIPIGIALFVQSFIYNEGTFHDSITGMVAAIIGMIPEGLYLLTSVALAVSSVRLAQKKVLIHDMKVLRRWRESMFFVWIKQARSPSRGCMSMIFLFWMGQISWKFPSCWQILWQRRKKTMRRWKHSKRISPTEVVCGQGKCIRFLRKRSIPEP